jgi:hypothetical protein
MSVQYWTGIYLGTKCALYLVKTTQNPRAKILFLITLVSTAVILIEITMVPVTVILICLNT